MKTKTQPPDGMTEEELALFYESRKGDLSLWQSKPAKIRVRRGGPSTVFSLRLAPEELEALFRAAQAQQITLSEFIRRASMKEATEGAAS
jgi:hypothetical protein